MVWVKTLQKVFVKKDEWKSMDENFVKESVKKNWRKSMGENLAKKYG